jgi:hypothetical protein
MSEGYRNAIADYGAGLITHIGLVDDVDTELSGGDYARKAVTWASADDGTVRPTADLVFDIPAGVTVAGWRGFSALTEGTNYGGEDLTAEVFAGAGQYKLIASGTGILHT